MYTRHPTMLQVGSRVLLRSGATHLYSLQSRQAVRRYSSFLTSAHRWRLWGVSAAVGGVVCVLGYSLSTQVSCLDNGFPPLTLYQYATCPYCCKTRAFLDYYQVPYSIVEVNPLFRREIKFSEYRKVPILRGGGVQVNDSSVIMSVLRTMMLNDDLSLAQALGFYPMVPYTDSKGKTSQDRANKYFIMSPGGGSGGLSLAQRREEREWREWVDNKLVHTIPPNIYRTLSEAVTAFDYISSAGNFSTFEQLAAKYVGALSMFLISKNLKRRYQLREDVRESLYECCNKWTYALGDRRFMGGETPNLADLAVYGVLSSIEGMGPTFTDMLTHTRIGPWYFDVQQAVNKGEGGSDM